MTEKTPSVADAYALKTPDDNRRLYADWAQAYDTSFAQARGYLMPGAVAAVMREKGGESPVLDAGAGTGLVGEALQAMGDWTVDALDITPEMLAVAAAKGLYRHCIEADLTRELPLPSGTYSSIVSAGTFTHGHVGPEALHELMRVAAPGALFVLTIKKDHYEERGFAAAFAAFGAAITGFDTVPVPIYARAPESAQRDGEGLIAVFRKA
jgi:predicted TPR repeat methyltransferase